jgi:hypothetical protein
MKKIVKITEAQLLKVIEQKTLLFEQENTPLYASHWETKFIKSIEILLKLGRRPDDLVKTIQIIANKKIN